MNFIEYRKELWDSIDKDDECVKDGTIRILISSLDNKDLNNDEFEIKKDSFTVLDLAKNQKLKGVIACKVNDNFYDVWRPLTEDSELELFTFNSNEGKHVFWHSSAHILGQALEKKYGCNLSVGPALKEGGFYYEGRLPEGNHIINKDFEELEGLIKDIVKENQSFERLEIQKDIALEMFKYNCYKTQIINDKVPDGEKCTVYRCGDFIDLCRGPHLPRTGLVKSFKIMLTSGSYFKGDNKNDQLERVYGISFPDYKMLKQHLRFLEEAKKRDHREIGKKLELFYFNEMSPGCCFFLPHGTRIYRKLESFMRDQYWKREFEEVMTPTMAKKDLWQISGHWDKYKENMFCFSDENDYDRDVKKLETSNNLNTKSIKKLIDGKNNYASKSMNCPLHCILFKSRNRSYKDLPLRYADFGTLHRNELVGTLSGLTRVRKFSQDDAHIFCKTDQIEDEIKGCLEFLKDVYKIFGFDFTLELSTRPKKYIGSLEIWENAENKLKQALDANGLFWSLNKGDGAFYGPKIDIHIKDVFGREHQCATIQLDFNLPSEDRFNLKFVREDGELEEPVIIHRAIYGSFERFIAILLEHYSGKLPFWISPRQIMIIPVAEKYKEYGLKIKELIRNNKFYTDIDLSNRTLNKRIREAQIYQYNLILVVGEREENNYSVNIRCRDKNYQKEVDIRKFIDNLNLCIENNCEPDTYL